MKAEQYIYTSFKNGDLPDKGFMIYSKSEGITETECNDIKFVMQYAPPSDMPPNPTEKQIYDNFPYSFAFFRLSTNRLCVAQSTYLGKDYSGRYGNYIIYALVFSQNELNCYPCDMFGEKYIKLSMTEEELNAKPPIPALENLDIETFGSIVNDDLLMEFISEREQEFSYFIAAVLRGKQEGIPVYINDTREHLVLWMAALHRALPLEMAKKLSFNTYTHDHKKFSSEMSKERNLNLLCLGVRPDENYFNYSNGCKSSRQIVLDFDMKYRTENIPVPSFAKAMAASYVLGMDEINDFIDFLNEINFYYFSNDLEAAYKFFRLYVASELSADDKDIEDIISFGNRYCEEYMNSEVGAKILDIICKDRILDIKYCQKTFVFLYKYSFFMRYSIHDYLYKIILHYAKEENKAVKILDLLDTLKNSTSEQFWDFLNFFFSEDFLSQLKFEMNGNNKNLVLFVAKFVLNYHNDCQNLTDKSAHEELLKQTIPQVCHLGIKENTAIELLYCCKDNLKLIIKVLSMFATHLALDEKEKFCISFTKYLSGIEQELAKNIKKNMWLEEKTLELCAYMSAKEIRDSRNPIVAFWASYEDNFKNRKELKNIDLASMVEAGLSKTNNIKNLIKIVEIIPEECFKSWKYVKVLFDKFLSQGMKALIKIDSPIIFKLVKILNNLKQDDFHAIYAISFLKFLQAKAEKDGVYPSFAKEYKAFSKINLSNFEKRDYNIYLAQAVPVFMPCIYDEQDFNKFVEFCFNKEEIAVFCLTISTYLKKLKKRQLKQYKVLIDIMQKYIRENKQANEKTKLFFETMRKYL